MGKTKLLACDFETTTDPADCRVWAACAVNVDTLKTEFIGNSIESFMEYIEGKDMRLWFHNLKFDSIFLIHYLLSHGYEHSKTARERCFDTLITDTGVFYSLTIWHRQTGKNKWVKTTIYDSLKKLPFSVAQIAKAFELPLSKLSIDYDEYRAPGHELTPEECEYIVADCRIVAEALKIQRAEGLKKMTNASDAMSGYKAIVQRNFDRWFPQFPVEMDVNLRRAYRGGYVYLKPEHAGKRGLQGVTLDINSLYPSVMYDRLLPYGYPIPVKGKCEPTKAFPLFIQRLTCNFRVKPGHLPMIQIKKGFRFSPTEYITSSDGCPVELVLTSVDLALFYDHYDVYDEKWHDGFLFRGAKGMFCEYIDHWMTVKETSTGAKRQLAKLMLNSLYGRFAMDPRARQKYPVLDHDGVVHFLLDDPEERDPVYTPMGAFITAYAREKTIRSAQSVYDRFIYSDTDSIHLIGTEIPPELDVHPTKLGAWKNEGTFTDSKFLRAKTYMETYHLIKGKTDLKTYCQIMQDPATEWIERREDGIHYGSIKVTCAGMPDNIKDLVTYDNFDYGATFDGKLLPKMVPGGVVLIPTAFTIR